MNRKILLSTLGLVVLACVPVLIGWVNPGGSRYYLHLAIQMLLWAQIYTAWSLMGRFGLTSLGHGAFTGIGAYATVLLWNQLGLTPLLGIPIAVALAVVAALLVGYPCFLQRIKGHYFALMTMAMVEFVRLCIVGWRGVTGGSLGTQPTRHGDGVSLYAVQFEPNRVLSYFIVLALWAGTLYVWSRVDRSMDRLALDALGQDEEAAAAAGVDVTREKLKITAISAALCALGGALFAQYQMYVSPETIAGLGISLNIVFGAIAGGMGVLLGPTVGAVFTQLLSEGLRVTMQSSQVLSALFGTRALALDMLVYGVLLVLFIIYMPKGILGTLLDRFARKRSA
ncbi:MAG: branched-chain amino acid ABC transporter permease [Bosea sp.]|jgi:branched-chain amino acid transport system permease protein|uniref:branched-chain amino acid ABC transporter permease n=1 Tax=Bosea sp. (in: a-proteobacteria) TaxID=1871050 RepID=UPI001ACB6BC2|nr:branched-chain amino acid ABC transporter permease [Bosea sp. (in: a-proteobacteria)]MBN9469357.1 branched-chain amino acid ABC transporter permease [Bosea sp. (in: a-proteobacteria)]